MARAKKKVLEIPTADQTTSTDAESRSNSVPSSQGKAQVPARQSRATRPMTSRVTTSPSGSFNDQPTQPAKVETPRKANPAVVVKPPVEAPPPTLPEEFNRQTSELVESLKGLRSEVSELRTQLASARVEIEQARRDLKDAVHQNTVELGQGVAIQTDVNSTRDLLATLSQEVKQQWADFVSFIREAREQSRGLSQHLGEIHVSFTRQGDELRTQMQADRQEWNNAGREIERLVSRIRQEAEKASRANELPTENHRIEDQSLVRNAPAQPATQESSGVEVGHNRLGVTVDPGIVVTEVIAGTPGKAAGLELGDVVDSINGQPVRSGQELQEAILAIPSGDDAVITILRSGTTFGLTSRMAAATSEQSDSISPAPPSLGVTVEDGVVVSEVLPGTSAWTAGLQSGDVITCINDESVVSGAQLRKIIQPLPHRAEVKLKIARGTEVLEMPLHLDECAPTSEVG